LDRPTQPLFFHDCRRVRWEGVTITHSPCWTLVFSCCNDVRIHALKIDNNLRVPNNDGIHFTGTSNIVVSDSTITAGDDAIAVSAITNPASPCENITITNCILTSHSSALRFGYRGAKVRHVTASNLVIRESQRGIFLNAGDDGYVEDVAISDVVLETRMFAGNWWGKGEPLVIAAPETATGRIRDVTISHVRGTSENSIVIVGDRHSVSDITLNDWSIAYGYSANTPLYGRTVDLSPNHGPATPLSPEHVPWLFAQNVNGLALHGVRARLRDDQKPTVSLEPVMANVTSR
jgi:polygalacturonase